MLSKYKDLLQYISKTDDACSKDVICSLVLVRTSLDKTLKRVKKEISSATESNSFEDIGQIAKYCQQIKEIDEMLKNVWAYMEADSNQNDFDDEPCGDGLLDKVVYEDYDADKNEIHSLDEDFTHKKPCAIVVNNHKMVVGTWREALVSVCEYLYKIDKGKMVKLERENTLHGKKRSLLGKVGVVQKNMQIPGSNIYVWINFSAQDATEYIIKLLHEYNIPMKDVKVYIKRDLSPLHE